MGFRHSGQGPVDWLHVLCGFIFVLALAGGGCAPKVAGPGSGMLTSDQQTACAPVTAQENAPVPSPPREADFSAVFDDQDHLFGDMSLNAYFEEAEQRGQPFLAPRKHDDANSRECDDANLGQEHDQRQEIAREGLSQIHNPPPCEQILPHSNADGERAVSEAVPHSIRASNIRSQRGVHRVGSSLKRPHSRSHPVRGRPGRRWRTAPTAGDSRRSTAPAHGISS